jgi:hypothetical protein
MNLKKMVVGALVVAFASTGCVKKGSVTEAAPLLTSVSVFKSVQITVSGSPSVVGLDELKSTLQQKLMAAKIFTEVRPEGGDLQLQVVVTKSEKASELGTMFGGNSGAAEVQMDVKFVSSKDQKTLGQVAIMGNSKQNTSTSVGGIDTRALGGNQILKAYDQAADQLVEYLQKHR